MGRRRKKKSNNTLLVVIIVLTILGLLLMVPVFTAAYAFYLGYQRGAALAKGTEEWKTFESEKFGFKGELPGNYIQDKIDWPVDDTRADRVLGKHVNGTYVEFNLVSHPDASKWPGRVFRFESVEGVVKLPATGFVVRTADKQKDGKSYHSWDCAMSWGTSFCYVSVFGEDRENVKEMADRVYNSLRFTSK